VNFSFRKAPSAEKHSFIIEHYHCANSWLFHDTIIDRITSDLLFLAVVKLHGKTWFRVSSVLHIEHLENA